MGSSSSKPARKLGSEVASTVSRSVPSAAKPSANAVRAQPGKAPPSEYGAATAKQGSQYAPPASTRREQEMQRQQQQASETKSADIMRDAYDPQFLQNLTRLGQVKVPKNATNYQPTDQMLRILEARERASLDSLQTANALSASSSTATTQTTPTTRTGPPRISANTITLLLDDRKHCETQKDLELLALEYDLPLETIESLAKYYNSPTMAEEIRDEADARQEDQANRQDERAPTKVRGVWVVPKLQEQISG
ncbi:uncharacterized protein UMAG_10874 [Mycosarcoma maydis]|uniref:Uncharacterized protein n=1 Tax=Mycosarcoma maydis TaxID=5270 RepID=A0A0D1CBM3_MYCMD|nr:uncharacterized protein UMAG_10874 [Ustilago maydis 521]KIS70602.1 hypothetical protein UMAG_10874 [Ustilago maydis 521]|eukprot:XP_011388005.1 hypothetical protein UMAG_10874 [Ustilago maydis 521]